LAKTRSLERGGGGKAVPVKVAGEQLAMDFATAECSRQKRGAESVSGVDLSAQQEHKAPKAKDNHGQASPVTMNEVVARLDRALDKVVANKGAAGPDRQSVDYVQQHWTTIRRRLADELTKGDYQPGTVRRVWIPKADKGQRGLSIPNVIDRVVQEAVRAVLEPHYEPNFHPSSHGFRPKRSCHTAIAAAKSHIDEGYHVVVDIDLEKFFDRVHHQRLLSKLAQRVGDRSVLVLIGRMLKASVVMADGVKVATEEGVPQGGPLSPLLSNIVLDELDWELHRRGLRFVRYADDSNIYVRSERAGRRVMASIRSYITSRLRLVVNESKSAVARPEERHFLGFRLSPQAEQPSEVLLSERSEKRLRRRIRELTSRNSGRSLTAMIARLNEYLRGWLGHFRICTSGALRALQGADAHLRRRLRALLLKQWKTKRTRVQRLIRLGVQRKTAWRRVYEGRKSIWALSHDPAVDRGLRNAYFAERGLVSLRGWFEAHWADIAAPRQRELFAEAERS
jgi:group II intron reverse transcriptase/maturase